MNVVIQQKKIRIGFVNLHVKTIPSIIATLGTKSMIKSIKDIYFFFVAMNDLVFAFPLDFSYQAFLSQG